MGRVVWIANLSAHIFSITMIGTLTVDGWAVTSGQRRRV